MCSLTWLSFLHAIHNQEKHPDSNSWNVNDICLFPFFGDTNEVLRARSPSFPLVIIRDSKGSLGMMPRTCDGSIKQRAKRARQGQPV